MSFNRFHSLVGPFFMVSLVMLSVTNCSVIFPVIAPFEDLPAPTGPFSVATYSATWTDTTREETFTPEEDFRRLVVQVWFPVPKGVPGEGLPYIDDPELRLPAIARQLRLPQSLIRHFGEVRTHAVNAHHSTVHDQEFPVILFSHGLSGMRFQNTALIEELVSQGYVVLAPDHSYGANITIFDDGTIAHYEAGERRSLNASFVSTLDLTQIHILVGDLQFIINTLDSDRGDPFLRSLPMDLEHLGIVGHSLGGAAALSAMALDDRIRAAMVLDGWYAPVPDSIITTGINQPIFHLGQGQWEDETNYQRLDTLLSHGKGASYKILIPRTLHTDFTDMPLFTPFSRLIGYTRVRDPLWMNSLIREHSTTFFDVYLKDQPPALLESQILKHRDISSSIYNPRAR